MSGQSRTRTTRHRTSVGEHGTASGPPDGNDGATETTDRSPDVEKPGESAETDGRETDGPETGTGRERESHDLSDDVRFDALQNDRRREVIRYLRARDGPVETGELAEHVAVVENDTTVEALSSTERKRVYVGLYQCHLPRLHDMDVVEFDRDRGHVSLGPAASQLYAFLPGVDDPARPWELYYLGYAAASVVVLAGVAVLGLAMEVIEIGIAAAIVAGLGAVAVAHTLDSRR